MKDHHIPQLVDRITNDLRLSIPSLPSKIRSAIGLSVSRFMHDVVDAEESTIDDLANQMKGSTGLAELASNIHIANRKWWLDLETGGPLDRNKGELQMLIVSEIAEAMEGVRKSLPDDHLPHRSMEEVEMADALIRILDYCAGFGLDIEGAVNEKLAYNANRADHKPENRLKQNGKKF